VEFEMQDRRAISVDIVEMEFESLYTLRSYPPFRAILYDNSLSYGGGTMGPPSGVPAGPIVNI